MLGHPLPPSVRASLSRRDLLRRGGMGFGLLGLAGVLADDASAAPARERGPGESPLNPLAPRAPHFPGRARQVVHLFMNGGPSHVDTFDPKPLLAKYHGRPLPNPNLRTERKTGAAMGSPFTFRKYGASGLGISDLFPNVGALADGLCVVR